jgi:PAS domain S-box-containing protein
MKLLVADKIERSRELKGLLEKNGYRVQIAESERKALKLLKNEHFDGILSNSILPEIDGFQLCRTVKQDDVLKKIPFIFLVDTFRDEEDFAFSIGADLYLEKSQDFSEILSEIKKKLENPGEPKEMLPEEVFLQEYNAILKKEFNRNQTEEFLQKSEPQYRNFFIDAPIGIYRTTPDGRILMSNPKLVNMLGYESFEELAHRNLEKDVYEAGYLRSVFKELLEREGQIVGLESQWIREDGTAKFFRENAKAVRDNSGAILYYEGTVEDITEHKQAEEALRKSEERFRVLAQNSSDIVYILDSKSNMQYVSPNVNQVLGYHEMKEGDKRLAFLDFVHPQDHDRAKKALAEVISNPGKTMVYEFRIRHANGTYQWMESWGKNLLDNPAVSGIVLNIRNVSERKRAEEELRDSEERYRNVVELAPDGIVTVDLKGTITSCNPVSLKLTGYPEDELVGNHFSKLKFLRAGDLPGYVQIFNSLMKGKVPKPFEVRWVTKDGSTRVGEAHLSIMKKGENPAGFQIIIRDITDHKEAEGQLRESEEKYRNIVELAPDGIITADLKGVVTSCNPAFSKLTGYSEDEIVGKHFTKLPTLRLKDIPRYMKIFNSVIRNKVPKPFQLTWFHKDGTARLGEVHLARMREGNRIVGFQAIARDITERKRTEERLRLSEEKYRTLIENLNVGVYRATPGIEGRFIDVNPAFVTMLGYETKEKVLKLRVSDVYINPVDRATFNEKISAHGSVKNEELWLKKKDGTPIIVSDTATTVYGADGTLLYFDGILEDITERKQAEDELRTYRHHLEELVEERTSALTQANEKLQKEITERILIEESLAAEKERLSVTLRSIGDGVITADTAGIVILINKVAEWLTGWKQEEAVGRPLHEVFKTVDEKTHAPCENPVTKVLSQGTVVGLGNNTVLVSRDGTEKIIADSGAPIRDKNSRIIGVVLVFRDVTEKRKMEQQLLRAEKLESLGILAGGIAHDFNNILTAILSNISLAKMYAADDKTTEKLSKIEKASIQARNLTHQLLTFSKGGAPIKKTISIPDVIKDSASFALRGSNVKCSFSMQDDLWSATIDEGQISQVINNLVINADQAMPEGGTIQIRTENVVVAPEDGLPLEQGQYVRISIQDEGIGIPEKYIPKIFDPYFTTKQKGSGLGLGTSYSIIKQHNGYIDVESDVGVGTTFHIWLPASIEKLEREKEKLQKALGGEGRILFMDDEKIVRDAAGEILQYLGYDVKCADDGEKAVALYETALQEGVPFDAVIMDLTIPGGMGGKEAIQELLKIDPEVKAVVSSGYSNDPVMANYRAYGFKGVVAKPYAIEELSETLHEVLKSEQ